MNYDITFCTNKRCTRRNFCDKAEENHKDIEWLKDRRYFNFNCEDKLRKRLEAIPLKDLMALKKQFEWEQKNGLSNNSGKIKIIDDLVSCKTESSYYNSLK